MPINAAVWTSGQAQSIGTTITDEDQIVALGFPDPRTIRTTAFNNPGSYWYMFGEANRHNFMTGERFAPVFQYYYNQIKLADSSANIIGTSVLNWDWICLGCGGYQQGKVWLQAFINAYENLSGGVKPPVDVWAIDAYPIDWVRTPNDSRHADIVIDQLTKMRQYLNGIAEYANTPIWVTEIAVHVGYDGWKWDPFPTNIEPVGGYNPDKMSDYMTAVLDWLDANAVEQNIEKWFFFKTWIDIANPELDGYMGISFFDNPAQGASRTCLGDIYRARSLDDPPVVCDAAGNTVPAP